MAIRILIYKLVRILPRSRKEREDVNNKNDFHFFQSLIGFLCDLRTIAVPGLGS